MRLPTNTPIVVFGDDWGRHVSTMQHIFRWIIPHYPVIWVNGIGHRVPRLTWDDVHRAASKLRVLVRPSTDGAAPDEIGEHHQPQTIIHPRVLPWHHWPGVHALNTRSLLRSIKGALQQYSERPVLVTGSPPSVGVVGELDELVSVYFCMDDFLHHPAATAKMIAPLERRLLERVDVLVATAHGLTKTKRPRSGRTHYLPQGVNFEHFAVKRPTPTELQGLPRPIIGFAGRLSDCCDLRLLARVAKRFPEASLVLVGPLSVEHRGLELPNVHCLGHRPYQDLPAYVQEFDVALVPYLVNDWTRAVDPLKLLEYLAAGVGVVSTAIPEVRKYEAVVRVTEDASDFVLGIERALTEDRETVVSRGQALARQHTWKQRAQALLDIIGTGASEQATGAMTP